MKINRLALLVALAMTTLFQTTTARIASRTGDRERGDVPGWVLVTLMSAGLVVAIWAIAGPALEAMVSRALENFKAP